MHFCRFFLLVSDRIPHIFEVLNVVMDEYDLHELRAKYSMRDSWPGVLRRLVAFDVTHDPKTQAARYDPTNVLLEDSFDFYIRILPDNEDGSHAYSRQRTKRGIFIKTFLPVDPENWTQLLVCQYISIMLIGR